MPELATDAHRTDVTFQFRYSLLFRITIAELNMQRLSVSTQTTAISAQDTPPGNRVGSRNQLTSLT